LGFQKIHDASDPSFTSKVVFGKDKIGGRAKYCPLLMALLDGVEETSTARKEEK
jgi:hypothetical protein